MKKINICVFTSPISKAGLVPLSNIIKILKLFTNNLYLITGNEGYTFFKDKIGIRVIGVLSCSSGSNLPTRIAKYVILQLKTINNVIRISKKVDIFIFYIGGPSSLALAIAKLMRKQIILVLAGSDKACSSVINGRSSILISLIQDMNLAISDKIMIYSKNIISEYRLQQYNKKIYIAHSHFLDFKKFNLRKDLKERRNLVGYIGRLDAEKGILNFLNATSRIDADGGIHFLIGGDGSLRTQVEYFINNQLNNRIKFVGWINHDDLPAYLNELKLLVVPSYTEGLPNIILEAMACGTPVLATSVGSIPDIIKNKETGFIMANNSPDCIANNIIDALNHPNLEQIAQNAYSVVSETFTFEKAVTAFRELFNKI